MDVLIVQEYVPEYRVPFFELLTATGLSRGIKVTVAAGAPNKKQQLRGDAVGPEWIVKIPQHELRVFGRRIVFRDLRQATCSTDLVIMEHARRNIDAYRLLLPKSFSKRPTALWGHGKDYTKRSRLLERVLMNMLMKRAFWYFSYTQGGADHARMIGFPAQRCTVVQNSVDTSDILAAARLRGRPAEGSNVGGLYLGSLDESKRLSFLLQSADLVHDSVPTFNLKIAGSGPSEQIVREFAAKRPWVEYVGRANSQQKARLLAEADIILNPGRVGLIAVDSLASGTPLCTVDWEFHAPEREYLNDETSLFCADSVESFASSVTALIGNPQKLDEMSAACFSWGKTVTLEKMVSNYLAGLEQIAKLIG